MEGRRNSRSQLQQGKMENERNIYLKKETRKRKFKAGRKEEMKEES